MSQLWETHKCVRWWGVITVSQKAMTYHVRTLHLELPWPRTAKVRPLAMWPSARSNALNGPCFVRSWSSAWEKVKDFLLTVQYLFCFCPLLRFAVGLLTLNDDWQQVHFFQPILAKATAHVSRCFHLGFNTAEPPYPSLSTSSCLSAPFFSKANMVNTSLPPLQVSKNRAAHFWCQ